MDSESDDYPIPIPINQAVKVGDRVVLWGELLTLDQVEGDFGGGRGADGSYIGGILEVAV